MRSSKQIGAALGTVLTSALLLPGVASADCNAGKTGIVVNGLCGYCHTGVVASDGTAVVGVAVPVGSPGNGAGKTLADWQTTLNRMVGYGGAEETGGASIFDAADFLA